MQVLELGAGAGLCGLYAALHERVTYTLLTDKASYVPLLTRNAGILASWGRSNVYACALPFGLPVSPPTPTSVLLGGQPEEEREGGFDLVLLSDVISALGDEGGFPALVRTLKAVCRSAVASQQESQGSATPFASSLPFTLGRHTVVLLAGKVRAGFEARFPGALVEAGFHVCLLATFRAWKPEAPVPVPVPVPPPGHYVCMESCAEDVLVHAAWLQ